MKETRADRAVEYHIPQSVGGRFVFVDGLTRSGKGLLSFIVPSLEKMEKINVCELFDMQVIPAMALGLDEDMAKALLRCQFNELAYNTFLSRNVNFRHGDESSIHNHHNPSLYFERLSFPEETVLERLSREWFFPFKTHDLLANREHLDKLGLDYKMIEIIRNPVDMCYSWHKRGWGHRWGTDPRSFALKYRDTVVPYYMKGREEEWIDMSEKERSVFVPFIQMEKCVAQYRKKPDGVLVVTFEDLITHPNDVTDKICSFLKTSRTPYTDHVIKNTISIKKLEPNEFKLEEYKGIRKKYFDMLLSMNDLYKKRYGMA